MKYHDQTLFFFTISFPYGQGETFIHNEFPYLTSHFKKIIIITSSEKKGEPVLPHNVTLHSLNDILKNQNKKKFFIRNLPLIIKILFTEFISCRSKTFFLKNIRTYNSTLISSIICASFIANLQEFNRNCIFYSFWMNNHALTLSILKMKYQIERFLFRVHGYDLILERWPHRYIAFQRTCHNYADKILTVSKKSLEYFKKTYPQTRVAEFSYLGSRDNGVNPDQGSETLTIVSCSNVIPLKRLNLIIDILKDVTVKVKWIHFGDGYLIEEIKSYSRTLPTHITSEFMGKVSQSELFEFYRNHHIDYFINVSDSEGLPFTIIEACSFGIPIIATDVGGTSEIVNENTGKLLPENFHPKEVARLLNEFSSLPYKEKEFRAGVRDFWRKNFCADLVYPVFIRRHLLQEVE